MTSPITMGRARGIASSTILVCLLLFLFTFSYARTPFDPPEIDQRTNHDSYSVSEENPEEANAILLPSDKPESEPATLIQWEPESTDFKTSKPGEFEAAFESMEVSTDSSETSDRVPFTFIGFRPGNPRIPRRPLPLSFRLNHRCHHNHYFKPWNSRLPQTQMPYDSHVILSKVKDKDYDPLARGEVRQIPARWTRFRHTEPRFSHEPNMERSEVLRRLYHRRDQEPENKATGLMKRIRKFLNHF